ncbi:MAG: methyltransferase domain-containing protein [Acidobacteriota bacterium]|nr:methyltransferase domain-containing protein [Acidobacteriota bacterium]
MTIHPVARHFDGAASDYERARPTFPEEAIEHLRRSLDLRSGRTVLDLAAGTGKLTRLLVPTGARVIAVEPLAGMRAVLEETAPSVETLEGTAEEIPLADGSVDAVTVAHAFHWFDRERAYRDIYRILRPGGALAVLGNMRDRESALQTAITALLEPIRGASSISREWDSPARAELFSDFEVWTHPWSEEYDRELLRTRMRSISFVAGLPEPEQSKLLDRVVGLADGLPERFPFPYVTEVFICRRQT